MNIRTLPRFAVWIAAGSVLSGLIVGAAGCARSEGAEPRALQPAVVHAAVLTVSRETAPATFEATGSVRAMLNATLSSKVMARVVAVNVREGDTVAQGRTLVSLDSRELAAAVDVAGAGYHSSVVGVGNAVTAAEMESKTSAARIAQAEAQSRQAAAALAAATAKLDLALAGPRSQELNQAHIAVLDAASSLRLAKTDLSRVSSLVAEGALPKSRLDSSQNAYELAKGRYDAAVQAENMAKEGSRSQEIRAAREGVAQARAALQEAKAGVTSARAAALQAKVRLRDVDAARAQVSQSSAALESARVTLGYARIAAPFAGRVVRRLVDPGSMASPGAPLLAVEGGEYRLEAVVPEDVIKAVSQGSLADVRIDALGDRTIQGRVVEIVPQGDPATHSFLVKYAVPATAGLKSGMFGRVSIRVGTREGIMIPASAAWEREGLHYVFAVNSEGIARLRIVTLGRALGDRVEALSGLNAGDRIVVGDRAALKDGDKVEESR